MSQQTYIRRRPGSPTYYARVTLPIALQNAREQAGLSMRREVWRSLHTTDRTTAHRVGNAVVERIKAEFDRELDALARGELAQPVRRHAPAENEIEERLFSVLRADLRDDQIARFSYPRQEEKERLFADARAKARAAIDGVTDPRQAQLLAILASLDDEVALDRKSIRTEQRRVEREAIIAGDPRDNFGHLAETIIEESNWSILPDSALFDGLCQRLQTMRLRALDTMEQRDEGRFEELPQAPKANVVALPSKTLALRGEKILELLDEYLRDEAPQLSPEEVEKKRMVIRFFAQHVGVNRSVGSIGRSDLRTFKQAIEGLPVSATRKREFRDLDFPTIIEKNARLRRQSIGRATQNNYLSTVSAFWRWLHANAFTEEGDLGRGLLRKRDKRANSRDSYSREELDEILSLPVFSGARALDDVEHHGDVLVNDWRFWIPLLCLFTGSRLGEVSQLRVQDVRKHGEQITLHITDEGEGMTVKNKHSVRVVPVHRDLLHLGFETYLRSIVTRRAERLFPDLKKNKRGRTSASAGNWWKKYLGKHEIDGNAYRFRHTFADALRLSGALDAEIGSLLGHSGRTMTEHYGNISQVTLERRSTLVNAVIIEAVRKVKPRNSDRETVGS